MRQTTNDAGYYVQLESSALVETLLELNYARPHNNTHVRTYILDTGLQGSCYLFAVFSTVCSYLETPHVRTCTRAHHLGLYTVFMWDIKASV